MKKRTVILPLILITAAVIYMIFINRYGFSFLLSIPGITAALCSAVAISLIKKHKLNINQYFILYLIIVAVGAIITIVLVTPFSLLAMPIIIPIAIIAESIILNKKTEYIEEKIILIMINPVLHLQIFLFVFCIIILMTDF